MSDKRYELIRTFDGDGPFDGELRLSYGAFNWYELLIAIRQVRRWQNGAHRASRLHVEEL